MDGFRKSFEVDVHDLDFNGICRVSSFMRYMQSAAQMQLSENGMAYENLKEKGKAFIISKIRLEFSAPVFCGDVLEALTFPCISRGFSFIRCYALSKNGETIGKAISVWALIDLEKQGLVRVNDFDLPLKTYEAWDMPLGHVRMPSTMEKVGEYTVAYADLDQNKHINNTKYADIFSSYLHLEKKRIDYITISYANEAKFREKLNVYLAEENGLVYIRTVRPDGKVNAEAEIHITDI